MAYTGKGSGRGGKNRGVYPEDQVAAAAKKAEEYRQKVLNSPNPYGGGSKYSFLSSDPNSFRYLDDDDIIQVISRLGITGDDDWSRVLMQYLTERLKTLDTREYNEKLLDEQRLYDSPLNQLARMMSSGISREAAMQMISGSGSGSGAAPYMSESAPLSVLPPSQSELNEQQTEASRIQTLIGGLSAISGLVGLGMSMASAVTQITAQSIQNNMSQKALQGLEHSDSVMSALQNAVTSGVLSTADMDGFSNATDALNYINDHKDTNAFKPLFDSGAFQGVYGTKLGRDMFTQTWNSVRQSKDAGTLLDQYIGQQIAATELSQLDIKKGYTDLEYAIGELSRQDVEIQKIWNDVWNGNIQIEIAGEELKIKRQDAIIRKNEADRSITEQGIYNAVMNNDGDLSTLPDVRGLGQGQKYIAFSTWSDLYTMFNKAFAANGTQDMRDAWFKFYQNNNEAAQLMAGLQLSMSRTQSSAGNPDLNPTLSTLMSLYLIAKQCGAFDALHVVSGATNPYLPYLLAPNKAQ